MDVRMMLLCLALGAITEAASASLGLWLYEPSWLRIANIVIVFGGFFGWLSSVLAGSPGALRFLVGAAVGIAYEALNLSVLRAWSFPQNRLLFLHGPIALVLGVGVAWGFLPLVAPLLACRSRRYVTEVMAVRSVRAEWPGYSARTSEYSGYRSIALYA